MRALILIILLTPVLLFAQSSADVERQRAEFETELAQIEKEIEVQKAVLDQKYREGTSVERDIAILDALIGKAQLKIKSRNITINKLEGKIVTKTQTISELNRKISAGKESIAQLIRNTNEIDDYTIVEIILSNQKFSDLFEDIDSFDSIKDSLKDSFAQMRGIQTETNKERADLRVSQQAEIDARKEIESEKRSVERSEQEKQTILSAIEQEAKTYEDIIDEREVRAAQIRSALFALRDTAAIPFGEALDYANHASASSGVSPAFILAILKQESDFGENIGSCYLRNDETGSGVGKNTGTFFAKVMKATRDVPPFLALTKKLGIDPHNTPVSCPWSGGGYGGAMGPSQFIPSTWKIFEKRIAAAVGVGIANPWEPKHAITATSIYLGDLGADRGGYTNEINAACRYYSGRNCDNKRPANKFYGLAVMRKAQDIQENMIEPLQRF